MATMTFTEAVQEIRKEWRQIMPQITPPAKQRVNGETSWICTLCGHGTHGDGVTANPQSKDGNGLKCFGCGWSGDIIDFYMQTTGKEFTEAVTELAAMIGITIEDGNASGLNRSRNQFNQKVSAGNTETHPAGKTQQEATERPTEGTADYRDYYYLCHDRLIGPEGSAAREYLEERGVYQTALKYCAGYDPAADPANAPGAMGNERKKFPTPRIILPCSKGHYVARRIDGNPDHKAMNPSKEKGAEAPAIFNGDKVTAQEVQEIFITEGIFDALSILTLTIPGVQAIALNSTSNARALIEKLEQTGTNATFIIALDNDNGGNRATTVLQEGLTRLRIPFITANICNGCKDPNDALQANYSDFYDAVRDAAADARAYREKLQQEALQAERERQERTGAGMVDAFLKTVKTDRYKPVPTGITDIDYALYGGFTRQQLILLGAAPGAGKTALAQWIFEGMAKQGQTVVYLNLEMSREQILARSISRIAAQNGERITPAEVKQGYKWDFAQEAIVTKAAEDYKREIAPHMIYNPDGVTADFDTIMAYIEEEAKRAEAAGLPAPLVVLDYLQIITGREREDGTALIKRAVGSLKRFAMQHNTVVFAIIAHNRAANQSGTVTMESGRDTSALEYSADLQLGLAFTRCLYRSGQDRKEADALTPEERRLVTLKITKGRDAKIGAEVDLFFDGETMTYRQLAKYEEPAPLRRPKR